MIYVFENVSVNVAKVVAVSPIKERNLDWNRIEYYFTAFLNLPCEGNDFHCTLISDKKETGDQKNMAKRLYEKFISCWARTLDT